MSAVRSQTWIKNPSNMQLVLGRVIKKKQLQRIQIILDLVINIFLKQIFAEISSDSSLFFCKNDEVLLKKEQKNKKNYQYEFS